MDKIKILLIMFLICFSFVQSQDIETEILNYDDTDLMILGKSRKLMIDKIKKNDFEKVIEVLDYLDEKFDTSKVIVLYDSERWLVDLWVGDYKHILNDVKNYKADSYYEFWGKVSPPRDFLWQNLVEYSVESYQWLKEGIKETKTEPYEKDFLFLFLDYLLVNDEGTVSTQGALNKNSDEYLDKHKYSPYNVFITNEIRYVYYPSDWAYGFDLVLGYNSINGGMNNYFKSNIPLGIGFDLQYKKLIGFFRFNLGAATKLKKEFNYGGTWNKGLLVNMYVPEISFGYPIYENNFIKATPYLGGNITNYAPPEKEANKPGNDVDLGSSLGYIYGVNFDIKFSGQSSEFASPLNYLALRVRIGYSNPNLESKNNNFTGGMIMINVGISIFGRKLIRDL